MASFGEGFAQGFAQSAGRARSRRLEREKFDYQKQQDQISNQRLDEAMQIQREKFGMEKEQYQTAKAIADRQGAAMSIINAAVPKVGYSGAIELLEKTGYATEAMGYKKSKLEMDEALLKNAQTKQMTEKQKSDMLRDGYTSVGYFANMVAQQPDDKKADVWQKIHPLVEAMAPGQFSPAYNADTQAKLAGVMAIAGPAEQKYKAQENVKKLEIQKGELLQRIDQLRQLGDPTSSAQANQLEKDLNSNMIDIAQGRANILEKSAVRGAQMADTLIKQYNTLTTGYRTSAGAYNKILESFKQGTLAGDIGGVYAFIKLLDPNSTVREGEVVLTSQAPAIAQKLALVYARMAKGQLYTQGQRDGITKEAQKLFEVEQRQYDLTLDQYRSLAVKQGIDPKVFPDYTMKKTENIAEGIMKDPSIPDNLKKQAYEAIKAGADPDNVQKRLQEMNKQQRDGSGQSAPQQAQQMIGGDQGVPSPMPSQGSTPSFADPTAQSQIPSIPTGGQ